MTDIDKLLERLDDQRLTPSCMDIVNAAAMLRALRENFNEYAQHTNGLCALTKGECLCGLTQSRARWKKTK